MKDLNKFIREYGAYLESIRRRLLLFAFFFLLIFLAAFFSSGYILKLFLLVFHTDKVTMTLTSPFQFIDLAMNIGLFSAIILSFPLLLYLIFSFLKPALDAKECKIFWRTIPAVVALYAFGFLFGVAVMYITLQALADINVGLGISNMWDVSIFVSQVLLTGALLGLIFEFPVLLTLLIRLKLVSLEHLKEKRRLAILSSFIITSLLPPTDGVTLLIMALPLVVLYEATILFNRSFKQNISPASSP